MRLFHKPGDNEAFEKVLAEGIERYAVELLTYCILPNHWHLVVRPKTDKALGQWMGWVNAATPEEQLDTLRECAQRGRPVGSAACVETTAARLDLAFTLRGPGRPRKATKNQ